MYNKLNLKTSYVLVALLLLLVCMSACSGRIDEELEINSSSTQDAIIVYETDSTEWRVKLFREHLYYNEAVEVELPNPWHIPTREEAQILKNCTYPHSERFITSDSYTFAMPSMSVSKAGMKTKYSVLGLYKRPTVINITF